MQRFIVVYADATIIDRERDIFPAAIDAIGAALFSMLFFAAMSACPRRCCFRV